MVVVLLVWLILIRTGSRVLSTQLVASFLHARDLAPRRPLLPDKRV